MRQRVDLLFRADALRQSGPSPPDHVRGRSSPLPAVPELVEGGRGGFVVFPLPSGNDIQEEPKDNFPSSYPRSSRGQALRKQVSTPWIPASAGMTIGWDLQVSNSLPLPEGGDSDLRHSSRFSYRMTEPACRSSWRPGTIRTASNAFPPLRGRPGSSATSRTPHRCRSSPRSRTIFGTGKSISSTPASHRTLGKVEMFDRRPFSFEQTAEDATEWKSGC